MSAKTVLESTLLEGEFTSIQAMGLWRHVLFSNIFEVFPISLSLAPLEQGTYQKSFGAGGRPRTRDLPLTKRLLYRTELLQHRCSRGLLVKNHSIILNNFGHIFPVATESTIPAINFWPYELGKQTSKSPACLTLLNKQRNSNC